MGISVSSTAILRAVHALSRESVETLQDMGQTLTVMYAWDNFDVDFKNSLPTVESTTDTLTHMTSGCFIHLEHGVIADDLKCSKALWDSSPLNPNVNPALLPRKRGFADLLSIHPEPPQPPSGLTRTQRFNAWKFLFDLCAYGPLYFRPFSSKIGEPEAIDKIPVTKMQYAPARAMDIPQSTVGGNIRGIATLANQGGVGDPNDKPPAQRTQFDANLVDIAEYILLFSGDLGAGERALSLLKLRSLEKTPWRRFQFLVFVMGLFHLKMAAAEAIWRIFIEPKTARQDETCLMNLLALHRPCETGKIGSDPGFRRMHEVIGHDGTALRLDAWRVEAKRRDPTCTSLALFAESTPSLAKLEDMANYLAANYVAGGASFNIRSNPLESRDQQNENIQLMHQLFLLYEELTYSMNYGDIGRVETVFLPWICIFKQTGKHKYAAHMMKFLTDVHFVYGERLRYVYSLFLESWP